MCSPFTVFNPVIEILSYVAPARSPTCTSCSPSIDSGLRADSRSGSDLADCCSGQCLACFVLFSDFVHLLAIPVCLRYRLQAVASSPTCEVSQGFFFSQLLYSVTSLIDGPPDIRAQYLRALLDYGLLDML
jgi:hypothetical protein